MLRHLNGDELPPLPVVPGVVHECPDAPMPEDELAEITSPTELALCAGISTQAAWQRLQRARNEGAGTSPPAAGRRGRGGRSGAAAGQTEGGGMPP